MSPTATIASVVVALLFLAWLFQSDTRDPAYDAWLKRQQSEQKADMAQKASMGITVTDSGVTKDNTPLGAMREKNATGGSGRTSEPGIVVTGSPAFNLIQTKDEATTRPVSFNTRPGFGASARLNGTYVGVAFLGDTGSAAADAATITLRRDGTFVTQNMFPEGLGVDAGTAPLERGSGRYTLSINLLDMNYTDGLARSGGTHRSYIVEPVEGDEAAPTAITIQGKIFKLFTAR